MNNLPEEFPNPFTLIHQELAEIKNFLFSQSTAAKEEDEILNIREAADFINLSVPSMYRLCSAKELPNFKSAGKVLFSKKELTAWLLKGRRKTVNETNAETLLAPVKTKKAANLKIHKKTNGK